MQPTTTIERKLLVQRFEQRGQVFYVTAMAPSVLEECEVPRYDPVTKKGYQRQELPAHVNHAARDLMNPRTTFGTSILLNIREKDTHFEPVPEAAQYGVDLGILTIPAGVTLYLVDGQHRRAAIRKAKKMGAAGLDNFMLPVVIANWQGEGMERKAFSEIQDNAKGLKGDLKLALHAEDALSGRTITELIQEGKLKEAREAKVSRLMDELNTHRRSFFKGKLKQINPDKEAKKADQGSINRISMSKSLDPFLRHFNIEDNVGNLLDTILNYWEAIEQLCPEAAKNKDAYPYLYNTTGLYIMHKILVDILVKAKGDYSVKRFVELLEAIGLDSGYFAEDGDLVGVGGMGGFNAKADELRSLLIMA